MTLSTRKGVPRSAITLENDHDPHVCKIGYNWRILRSEPGVSSTLLSGIFFLFPLLLLFSLLSLLSYSFFFFFSLCLIFNRSHNCLPVLPYPFLLFYTVSNNPLSLSFLSFYPVEMYILKTVMAVPCTKGVDYLLASFVQFPPSLVPLNGSQSDIQCDIC